MRRRDFFTTLAAAAAPAAPAPRPNFILLLLDDLGWRDFGCYGNTLHETPELDRLAREGVRFTNAYAACPVCSPTRASIMTGKYPARLHLTDWIPGRKQWPAARLLTPEFEQQLPLGETTIAEALAPLGYRSGSVGKWHLGGKGNLPTDQGFAHNTGGDQRGGVRSFFGPFEMPGLENTTKEDYLTEKLTDAAEKFIEESAGKSPFFLYLPEYTVHIPLNAREALIEKYRRKLGPGDERNPIYAAMVETVDHVVKRLNAVLERTGASRNTVWIITSDNGGLRYEGGSKRWVTENAPLRAGKGHLYEGGIREPLIIHGPGVRGGGRVIDTPVSSVDYLPTIVELAGASAPGGVDGASLAGLLRGGASPRRDALYWHYPHYSNQGGVPGGAIRSGDWKAIEFYEDSRVELYNLKDDPGEKVNLAARQPEKTRDLRQRLDAWRKRVNAAMPRQNPAYDPAKANQGLTGAEPATPPAP
jgi:arylsulfatase A-like enzyme